jgi:hypothetical protein
MPDCDPSYNSGPRVLDAPLFTRLGIVDRAQSCD